MFIFCVIELTSKLCTRHFTIKNVSGATTSSTSSNSNNSSSGNAVVYRIRPTSKNFIIQPKVGVLEPQQSAKIEGKPPSVCAFTINNNPLLLVLLQPKNDKFRIIAAKCPQPESGDRSVEDMIQDQHFWDELEESKKDAISEKRLKCVFTNSSTSSNSGHSGGSSAGHGTTSGSTTIGPVDAKEAALEGEDINQVKNTYFLFL